MKKTLFMLFCLLCSIGAMAQKKTITGVVTDATGEAVIGASIVETGTTNGTVTDLDGNFTLSVANDGSIRVSFVGYQTQTLSVKGKSTFKIALKEDSEMLQEVVVTGYGGKQLRTKVTNSISKVKEETLKQGLYSNPAQALSGAVAGLSVSQTSGNPGAAPKERPLYRAGYTPGLSPKEYRTERSKHPDVLTQYMGMFSPKTPGCITQKHPGVLPENIRVF